MPTKEAKHIAKFLYKMILRHGCPLEIVSDQGREFLQPVGGSHGRANGL